MTVTIDTDNFSEEAKEVLESINYEGIPEFLENSLIELGNSLGPSTNQLAILQANIESKLESWKKYNQ